MRKILIMSSFILLILALAQSCRKEPGNASDEVKYDPTPYTLDIGRFPPPALPTDNPLTIQGVKLGRMLFYEKALSGNNTMTCASCHQQQFAFNDTARFSIGIHGLPGKRNAMSVFNMAWNTNGFFWDGRAVLLRHQSLMPIQDDLEMDETLENVVTKLSAMNVYREQFKRAFNTEIITSELISKALEQFMNSIVSNNSKYDRYLRGEISLDSAEERGRRLFFAEYNPAFPALSGADCAHCHSGDNFENDKFMNNGLDNDAGLAKDEGRKKVSGQPQDLGKFKVTSLRNIALTAPYMHDGRFQSLEDVVAHYNEGLVSSSTLDPALAATMGTGLMLDSGDIADLVAFLKTLTDEQLIQDPRYAAP